jgi:hypothetical protein
MPATFELAHRILTAWAFAYSLVAALTLVVLSENFVRHPLGRKRQNRRMMSDDVWVLRAVDIVIVNLFKSRRRLEVENLLLRHQLNVALRQVSGRLRLRGSDRAILAWLPEF